MKLYINLRNEKGQVKGLGGNEYLDLDIRAKNGLIASFTLKENEDGDIMLFDEDDEQVKQSYTIKGKRQKGVGEMIREENFYLNNR